WYEFAAIHSLHRRGRCPSAVRGGCVRRLLAAVVFDGRGSDDRSRAEGGSATGGPAAGGSAAGGEGDAAEILGDHDIAVEVSLGLRAVPVQFAIALGEVGEHQGAHTGLGGGAGGLPRGQVAVLVRQVGVGVEEGGFHDQHVHPVGGLQHAGAQPGVHDEGE